MLYSWQRRVRVVPEPGRNMTIDIHSQTISAASGRPSRIGFVFSNPSSAISPQSMPHPRNPGLEMALLMRLPLLQTFHVFSKG